MNKTVLPCGCVYHNGVWVQPCPGCRAAWKVIQDAAARYRRPLTPVVKEEAKPHEHN